MIAGRFAFQGLSEYLTWQKIKQLEYSFPEGFDEQGKDLVRRLLVRVPLVVPRPITFPISLRLCVNRSGIRCSDWAPVRLVAIST